MIKRIFRSIWLASLIVLIAAFACVLAALYQNFSNVQQDQLKTQTETIGHGIETEGEDFFDGLELGSYRVTWIDSDGNVLYESDASTDAQEMENHLEREEVQEAIESGYGESRRYSDTVMQKMLYAAKLLDDGTIVRVSIAQSSIVTLTIGMLRWAVIIIIAALFLSLFLASRLSKRIVMPLNELNLDEPLKNEKYDELSPLLHRIDGQQKQLKKQKNELEQRRNELNMIIDNINEGMILLSKGAKIVTINDTAVHLLDTDKDCVGKDILEINRNLELQQAIERARKGERVERVAELGGGIYHIDAAPVYVRGNIAGLAVMLFDITQMKKNEQMRREFTSNVSHELRTPLHSIAGYAELLANHMVRTEDTAQFGEKIYTEAKRMIQLVDDILELSHLDEGAVDQRPEKTDLYVIVRSAVNDLESLANNAGITIHLEGEPAEMTGVNKQLYSIAHNLCENAVKYNHEGGEVFVRVFVDGLENVLEVRDTGIGIPKEEADRIFERFYRVDKSRSKDVQGTGLGLSIVKHAVQIHQGRIRVHSAVGQGTTIQIRFPR